MTDLAQGIYAGEFKHTLDSKNRLTIPAKWRFAGDQNQTYLAIPDEVAGCVTVYPPALVANLRAKLSSVSLGNRQGQRAIAKLFGRSETFSIDKSGRINLNERLYQGANIAREVMLVGTLDKFHLWNPQQYSAYLAEEDEDIGTILTGLGL